MSAFPSCGWRGRVRRERRGPPLIGFTGSLIVPKSVDVGAASALPRPSLVNVLLLALFGVQHSVMARRTFKQWADQIAARGQANTYVFATSVARRAVLPMAADRAPIVWRVDNAVAVQGLWAAFWLG